MAGLRIQRQHPRSFPSRRSAVMGLGPVVATSQPLAAQAGLQTMLEGGNAFDGAVTAAAVLAVVEPTGCGLGGDAFALLYQGGTGEIRALNGSGRSPRGLTLEALRAGGHTTMPTRGALAVTVPGAVDAWCTMLEEYGRMSLAHVLAPAIAIAERGFPVSELIAAAWRSSEPLLAASPTSRQHFLRDGRAPRPGEPVRLPAMARSLRLIADGGRDAFYRGPIASAIAESVQAGGGALTVADLAAHASTWDRPIGTDYGDLRVWECPPNGQGLAALLALAIARGWDFGDAPWGSVQHLHRLVEAMRLGMADARATVGDPDVFRAPLDELLSERYASGRRALVHEDRALAASEPGQPPAGDDTVYLATIDGEGNACSFIFSNYMGFGSGIVAGDTGIPLQNRGAGFTLAPGLPNSFAPGKRPFHTIIPALATRSDGTLALVFGVMGGHMQPQGHVQVVVNLDTFGMDPQSALDAPRFQLMPDGRLALEAGIDEEARRGLASLGHPVVQSDQTPVTGTFGGGQVIAVGEDGVRVAGSDPRKDGQAVAAGSWPSAVR